MIIRKEVVISCPLEDAYSYVKDFSQLYEWDDQVKEGSRVDLGPIREGSKFRLIYSLGGQAQELEYTLDEELLNQSLVFTCTAKAFDTVDKITFERISDTQTKVHYQAEIHLRSSMKEFFLSPIMTRVGDRVVSRLKEVLENEESIYPSRRPLNLLNLPYRFTEKGWNSRRKQFRRTRSKPKSVLITGATSGLGRSAVFSLAGKGCNLILLGRNEQKLNSLAEELTGRGFDQKLDLYICDMENLSSVESICDRIISDGLTIDVVINNAGALFSEAAMVNGIERTTVVDLLAPWVLSCRLLNALSQDGCLINVASGGLYGVGLDIEKLKVPDHPFSGSQAYALAKRAMLVFSGGLNSELEKRGIRVHCMHPGWADTPGVSSSLPGFYRITRRYLRTPFQGADTIVWLSMHNPKVGGRFWLDRQIQPPSLLSSTRGQASDYGRLRKFLDDYAKPDRSEGAS